MQSILGSGNGKVFQNQKSKTCNDFVEFEKNVAYMYFTTTDTSSMT